MGSGFCGRLAALRRCKLGVGLRLGNSRLLSDVTYSVRWRVVLGTRLPVDVVAGNGLSANDGRL
jgi:hypothetical protein